jgi:acyl-CoA thioester hydrolase
MGLNLAADMATHPEPHSGRFERARHLFALRVYYEDTDLSGIVYHANYLRWFERARSDMLRLLGIDQRAAKEAGEGVYSVADIAIRYLAPARLDDAVVIESTLIELGAASVRLRQRALRGDTVLAEAEIRVGFIAPDGRPRRQPQAWRDAFRSVLAAESPETLPA